ncbi:MAG: PqqD family peptide modification chaperone [Chloroflexi bacterium]|nr:PqqD family peptide modification chaperone [Chloroflexota bacterium]
MRAKIKGFLKNIFFSPKPMPMGNFHGAILIDNETSCRLHLRIEDHGLGILILNARTVLHLNATATEFSYHMIQETQIETVISEMMKRYRVTAEEARKDFQDFKDRLHSLIMSPDLDPETFLDFERIDPHKQKLSAPLRLDCALTYESGEGSAILFAPTDRVKRTLDTSEWKQILLKAWNAGIPHVVFTGGEPTLRPDIAELIAYCEEIGQVTGLITDGLRLTNPEYLHDLLSSGLDHIMLIINPMNEPSWEAIKDVIAEDIFLTAHLTLSYNNQNEFETCLRKLHQLNVKSLSLSAESHELMKSLPLLSQRAVEIGFSLVWDLPVPYSNQNPIAHEFETHELRSNGAGASWLYVEPDGDVLPGQGLQTVLGNILSDAWKDIWANTQGENPPWT